MRFVIGLLLLSTQVYAASSDEGLGLLKRASVESTSLSKQSMLACAMKGEFEIHIIFSPNNSDATLILSRASVKGSSHVSEHHYRFVFPKTSDRRETHITINRYSGKLIWEIGEPPFNGFNLENLKNTGICKLSEVKKAV